MGIFFCELWLKETKKHQEETDTVAYYYDRKQSKGFTTKYVQNYDKK